MSEPATQPSPKPFLEQHATVIALFAAFIGLPACLFSCITLYEWSTDANGPVLTMSASANAFAVPPMLPIPDVGDPGKWLGKYKTYVTLTLKNTGDLPADGVRIVLPRFGNQPASGRFTFERSDGAVRDEPFVSEFDIGTVEAEQLIDVAFWTTEDLDESDLLTISSQSGKEYVQLGEKPPFINAWYFGSLVNMLVVGIAVYVFDRRAKYERQKSKTNFEAMMQLLNEYSERGEFTPLDVEARAERNKETAQRTEDATTASNSESTSVTTPKMTGASKSKRQ